jgi:hypothetical protein
MENKYVYKITFGSFNHKHVVYTAYLNKQGTKISKQSAIYHVIGRLRSEGKFALAKELEGINKDPDYLTLNLLKIEIVPYVAPPKKDPPNKETQLQFKFGPTLPLKIGEAFKRSLNEMIESGVVGVASTHGGAVGNTDFYATGDSRIPKSLFSGVISRHGMSGSKKRKRKRIKRYKK